MWAGVGVGYLFLINVLLWSYNSWFRLLTRMGVALTRNSIVKYRNLTLLTHVHTHKSNV